MKKAQKKDLSQMLVARMSVTLNSIDEKAARKIKKALSKAASHISKKFLKKVKSKPVAKAKPSKNKRKELVPVEANLN